MLFHSLSPAVERDSGRGRPRASRRRTVLATVIAAGLALGVLPVAPAAAGTVPASVLATASAASSALVVAPAILAVRQSQAVPLVCFDRDLLAYINKARATHGAQPLVETAGLVQSANTWSTHLAAGTSTASFQHNPKLRATVLAGMPGIHIYGENIATFRTGQLSAYAMLKVYLASPTHRANIMNPKFRYVGIVTRYGSANSFNTINFAG